MPISLPDNPANGQTVQIGTIIYTYDATVGVWNSNSAVGPTLTPAAASTTVYADMTALIAATGMSNGDQAFVTGNNNLYIYSGSGWYKVATVQNDAPSAITGVNGTYQLAIDGTATTITAVSTDPEGFPLTWSYSASGLGSIATISQSDNVFTITPSTTVSDVGTFSLTINATDGVNGAVSTTTNLTLEFIVIVTNSKYTTLLATAVDTSDNNNITDSSSNSHSITVNGDAHAGTFSPYRSGGYSTYFDGSGDHILFVDSSLAEGTGDFTLECWFYLTADLQQNHTIFGHGTTPGYQIAANATNNIVFHKDGSNRLLATGVLNLHQWYHIVYQRASGTFYGFLDGVSLGTISMTDNFTNTGIEVGVNRGGTEYFEGYIRDVRIIKGTAFYNTTETTFTPPTETLTAVSGSGYSTTLLTCHKPYIADGGANSIVPTIYNDVSTKPFSPYDYNEYDAADHGGSVYFDGTGDYLTTTSSNYSLGSSSAFTFEFWYRFDDFLSSPATIFDYYDGSGNNINKLAITSANVYLYNAQANVNILAYAFEHHANIWYHFCWARDASNNHVFYINGQQVGTSNSSTNLNGEILDFGRRAGTYNNTFMKGHLSDISLIKGSVTRTSNFTPPIAPLSSSGSELHIKGTDASIIDKSQGANIKLVGTATGSTTQVKFADTKSIYSDGTAGNHLSIPADDSIFSKDYTIEFWMYPAQDTNLLMPFSKGVGLQFYHQSGNIAAALSWNNSSYSYNGNFGSITTNAWSHISLVRDSSASTYKFYINGTLEDTLSSASNIDTGSSDWIIGAFLTSGNYAFEGYIQDVRVTEGLTRYTTNFTPPTAPLKG
jgi:hypothetical protein